MAENQITITPAGKQVDIFAEYAQLRADIRKMLERAEGIESQIEGMRDSSILSAENAENAKNIAVQKADEIQGYVIPTNVTYSPTEIDTRLKEYSPRADDGNATTFFSIATAYLNQGLSGTSYIHVKTPFRSDQNRMFRFSIRGYSYASAKNIENTFVGYMYSTNGHVILTDVSGLNYPTIYIGSDTHVYLRIQLSNIYLTTIAVDYMRVNMGAVLGKGDVEIFANQIEEM